MARKRNPRRVALEVIETIRSNTQTMKNRWSWVPSTTYRTDENGRWVHAPRARKDIPAEEYRENQPEEWDRLAEFMDAIVRDAQAVAAYARRQAKEARDRMPQPTLEEAEAWAGDAIL